MRYATRSWKVAVAAGLACGCPKLDPFACTEDSHCDLQAGGVCLDEGCAYADDDCESDLRWHEDVPGVGGQCVEPDGGSTSTGPGFTDGSSSSDESTSDTGIASCGLELPLSIDTEVLSGDVALENYPLLVDVASAELASAASDGSDVFFVDEAGAVLPHELEAFDGDSVRAWVRLPMYAAGQALPIGLRFGDAAITPAYDPTAVWPETFVGVWHLDDPLTGPEGDTQLDSTIHAEHGETLGTMAPEQLVDAAVGSGLAFDGDDSVLIEASFIDTFEAITVSIWARVDSDGTIDSPFFERVSGHGLYPRCRKRLDDDGAVQCQVGVNEGTLTARPPERLVPRGELWLVAITYEPDTGELVAYVDGQAAASNTTDPAPIDGGSGIPRLGFIDEFGGHVGILDEFRVADTVLPEAWLAADAVSQADPSAVVSITGPATPAPCP